MKFRFFFSLSRFLLLIFRRIFSSVVFCWRQNNVGSQVCFFKNDCLRARFFFYLFCSLSGFGGARNLEDSNRRFIFFFLQFFFLRRFFIIQKYLEFQFYNLIYSIRVFKIVRERERWLIVAFLLNKITVKLFCAQQQKKKQSRNIFLLFLILF